MKMRKAILFLVIIITTLFTSTQNAKAQTGVNPNKGCIIGPDGKCLPNVIITAVPFLRIVPDARSGAMGDAGLAISADANAMNFNPSKLVFSEKTFGVSASYSPWLRSIGIKNAFLFYLSAYKQLDEKQAIGIGLRYLKLGDFDINAPSGGTTSTSNTSPNEDELSFAYARKLSNNFSAAITVKYIHSNLAEGQPIGTVDIIPINTGAVDISLMYTKKLKWLGDVSNLRIAGALSNLGPKVSYTNSIREDFLPANIGLGTALDLDLGEKNILTLAFDINKLMVPTPCINTANVQCDINPQDGIPDYKVQDVVNSYITSFSDASYGLSEELEELMYSMGMEYSHNKQFAVRAGYYREHELKGNRKIYTLGFGVNYKAFNFNFAYLMPATDEQSPLENTVRFSLLFDLESL